MKTSLLIMLALSTMGGWYYSVQPPTNQFPGWGIVSRNAYVAMKMATEPNDPNIVLWSEPTNILIVYTDKEGAQCDMVVSVQDGKMRVDIVRQFPTIVKVWIAANSTKYHTFQCQYWRDTMTEITESEAKAQGRTLCSACAKKEGE